MRERRRDLQLQEAAAAAAAAGGTVAAGGKVPRSIRGPTARDVEGLDVRRRARVDAAAQVARAKYRRLILVFGVKSVEFDQKCLLSST